MRTQPLLWPPDDHRACRSRRAGRHAWLVGVVAVAAALAAGPLPADDGWSILRTAPQEPREDLLLWSVVGAALAAAAVSWLGAAWRGRRWLQAFDAEDLAKIALVSAVHFVVSYAARWSGYVLAAVLGPLQIFVAGVASEGLASLLLAVAVVLVPRVGTYTLSSLTVFLLNALFSGQLGLVELLFVTVGCLCGEGALAALRLTTGRGTLREPAAQPRGALLLRLAVAVGAANAATLYVQYCLAQVLYRLYFAGWYIAAVTLLTGLVYGALGAAAGGRLGYQLRRSSV